MTVQPSSTGRDELRRKERVSMAREICSHRGENPGAVDRRGIEGWEKYEPLAGACIREAERLFALRGVAQGVRDRDVIDPTDPAFVKDQAHRERIEKGQPTQGGDQGEANLLPLKILAKANENNGGLVKFPSGRELILGKADAAALVAAPQPASNAGGNTLKDIARVVEHVAFNGNDWEPSALSFRVAQAIIASVPALRDVAYTAKEPDLERFCIAFTWAYGTALEHKHYDREPEDGHTPETLWAQADEEEREFMRGVIRDAFTAYSVSSTTCGCLACVTDGPHSSDCAVHNSPAYQASECTCSVPSTQEKSP